MSKAPQSRNWCFTHWDVPHPLDFQETTMVYLAYGEEVCPSSNRTHHQGFVVFKKKITLQGIKSRIWDKHSTTHYEIIRGSLQDNKEYCEKEGKYTEFGTLPKQGNRTDLHEAIQQIKNGKRPWEFIEEDPEFYHKYGRTLKDAEDTFNKKKKRNHITRITWLWGKTGTGKSKRIHEWTQDKDTYVKIMGKDQDWWDDYNGQDIVWFDDYAGEIPYNRLLQLADRYPTTVSRRGRAPTPFMAKHIFICSSNPPQHYYYNEGQGIAELERRSTIREITSLEQWVPNPLTQDQHREQ